VCCSVLSSTSKIDRSGELSDFERGLVIGCHISKKYVRDISNLVMLPKSMVADVIVKWKCEGIITTKPRTGRPGLMTDRDRRVLKCGLRNLPDIE
jgi:transposase